MQNAGIKTLSRQQKQIHSKTTISNKRRRTFAQLQATIAYVATWQRSNSKWSYF